MEIANINNIKNVLRRYKKDMVYIEFSGNISKKGFYIDNLGIKELQNFKLKFFNYDNEDDGKDFDINWLDVEDVIIENNICEIIFKEWNQFITIQKA